MAGHHHTPVVSLDEQYVFQPKTRSRALLTIGIGLLLLIIGCFMLRSGGGNEHHGAEHATQAAGGAQHGTGHAAQNTEGAHQGAAENTVQPIAEGGHEFHWYTRLYANIWLNNIFFTGIAIIGVFFVAVQYASQAGWSAGFLRVPMAFGYFLPVTGVIMLIMFFVAKHDLFHWTHEGLFDPKSKEYDEIIAGKKGFLNTPFFVIRMVIYFAVWFWLFLVLRKRSLQEDLEGGVKFFDRNMFTSAYFLIFFAVTSVLAAWDWVMSIDTHWFSTMFGWYMFASWWVTGLAVITLTIVNLKEAGYLPHVNSNHLHDLGKFMFAFSIFWTYVWFAQFVLIYYANIPEETVYFLARLEGYGGIYRPVFFLNIFINFVFPFLALMTRDSKRHMVFLKVIAIGIIVGHWFDFYQMIMPGTVGAHGGFGLVEFGTVAIYAGAFALVLGTFLAKAPLVARNHPMLEESLHHNI